MSNSRKFLELVLSEVAAAHASRVRQAPLSEGVLTTPVRVREYLQEAGLLEGKELAALTAVYKLLSEVGSHPYMALSEQARLLRHLSLTFSQFVMLRLQGSLASKGKAAVDA